MVFLTKVHQPLPTTGLVVLLGRVGRKSHTQRMQTRIRFDYILELLFQGNSRDNHAFLIGLYQVCKIHHMKNKSCSCNLDFQGWYNIFLHDDGHDRRKYPNHLALLRIRTRYRVVLLAAKYLAVARVEAHRAISQGLRR